MAFDFRNYIYALSKGGNPRAVQDALGAQNKYNLNMKNLMEQIVLSKDRFAEEKRARGVSEDRAERAYKDQLNREELQKTMWGFLQGGGTAQERPEFFEDYTGFTKMPTEGPAAMFFGRGSSGGSLGGRGGADYSKMSPMALMQMARTAQAQGAQDQYFKGQSTDMNKIYKNIMKYLT